MKYTEIIGKTFGKLTVVKIIDGEKNSKGRIIKFAECRCDCGSVCIKRVRNFLQGHTNSCGCRYDEVIKKGLTYLHGMTKTRFYGIYRGIRHRCNSPKCNNYYKYGGRGIKMLWKSFDEFKNDMYILYLEHVEMCGEQQTSIERIDNEGNYCKENCCWKTCKEQAQNRRPQQRWKKFNL